MLKWAVSETHSEVRLTKVDILLSNQLNCQDYYGEIIFISIMLLGYYSLHWSYIQNLTLKSIKYSPCSINENKDIVDFYFHRHYILYIYN